MKKELRERGGLFSSIIHHRQFGGPLRGRFLYVWKHRTPAVSQLPALTPLCCVVFPSTMTALLIFSSASKVSEQS